MAEPLLLALVAVTAAVFVAWPLLGGDADASSTPRGPDPEREALLVRHRLALEALRDVEADRRAGSLDEESYAAQRAEAEAHAAETLRALDAAPAGDTTVAPPPRAGQRAAAIVAGGLALLLLVGYALPSPFGIAERDARLERIRVLTDAVAVNPRDTAALAELADQYLAGGTPDEVAGALASLLLLRDAEPASRDAHQRLVTLLIRTGLWEEASAAVDRYAEVVGHDDVDIPFFRGLIARGSGDLAEAVRQFDRFLRLAPDDPRATMVQGLRDQAAASSGG
ncbi:MAG: c-type cytochrome biogenesis protein CcmI [Chloroflexota bacterium]